MENTDHPDKLSFLCVNELTKYITPEDMKLLISNIWFIQTQDFKAHIIAKNRDECLRKISKSNEFRTSQTKYVSRLEMKIVDTSKWDGNYKKVCCLLCGPVDNHKYYTTEYHLSAILTDEDWLKITKERFKYNTCEKISIIS